MRLVSRSVFALFRLVILVSLLWAFGPAARPVHAATLCVAPGGAGGCYASIQAAITAASAGDTITVAAGTYAENVVIDRPITLQGSGPSSIIQPAGGPAIALRSPATLPPPLTNVTIDGFTLKGSDGILIDKNWWGGAEALSVQNLAILNVTASGNGVNGLTIRNGAIVNGLTINNSFFDNNAQNGIAISNTTTQVNNVILSNTSISSNNQLGIYLLGPVMNGVTFSSVTVSNNGFEGMVIDNGALITAMSITSGNFLSNGRITASRGNGLGIAMPATQVNGLQVNNSAFSNNRNIGLYINRAALTNVSFTGTNFSGNFYEGIHITGSATINTFLLSGGAFQSNGGFGFLTRSGTGGVPTLSGLVVDGVQFNGNNNSGLTLVATLNGTNVIRNSTFYNSAWEDLDIGVGWLGSPTTINGTLLVGGNVFQAPIGGRAWASAYIDPTVTGVANVTFMQNCFNRTGWGLGNSNATPVSALNNWWNSAAGPNQPGAAGVYGPVAYTPWSLTAGVCAAPQVVYGVNTVPADLSVLTIGPTQIKIEYSKDVLGDGSAGAANNPSNYLLVETGPNLGIDTVSCSSGVAGDDVRIPINSATYSNGGGTGPFLATLMINNGVNLPDGAYRLFVCGTTSVTDALGNKLNGGAADSLVSFTVAGALPATGFAPGRVTVLPAQPPDLAYAGLGELWLEIPRLDVKLPIVGVPAVNGEWNVTWLGRQAGWLHGSAFPGASGNSVLTAHVWDAYNQPGPFAGLGTLMWGDEIILHAYGTQYVYQVRSLRTISPSNMSAAFQHEDSAWLTLLTCKNFNAQTGAYDKRLMVRAVLVGTR